MYLVCERILYASVSCMTKKKFGPYLISERIFYASVSYKRASTVCASHLATYKKCKL